MPDEKETDPHRRSALFEMEEDYRGSWSPTDLGSMLTHQLSMPFFSEVLSRRLASDEFARTFLSQRVCWDTTFRQVLLLERCPLEILELGKLFAKVCEKSSGAPLPVEITTVLYYLFIAAGLVQHRRLMTELAEGTVFDGFRWCLNQAWVEEPARQLLVRALAMPNAGAPVN